MYNLQICKGSSETFMSYFLAEEARKLLEVLVTQQIINSHEKLVLMC